MTMTAVSDWDGYSREELIKVIEAESAARHELRMDISREIEARIVAEDSTTEALMYLRRAYFRGAFGGPGVIDKNELDDVIHLLGNVGDADALRKMREESIVSAKSLADECLRWDEHAKRSEPALRARLEKMFTVLLDQPGRIKEAVLEAKAESLIGCTSDCEETRCAGHRLLDLVVPR